MKKNLLIPLIYYFMTYYKPYTNYTLIRFLLSAILGPYFLLVLSILTPNMPSDITIKQILIFAINYLGIYTFDLKISQESTVHTYTTYLIKNFAIRFYKQTIFVMLVYSIEYIFSHYYFYNKEFIDFSHLDNKILLLRKNNYFYNIIVILSTNSPIVYILCKYEYEVLFTNNTPLSNIYFLIINNTFNIILLIIIIIYKFNKRNFIIHNIKEFFNCNIKIDKRVIIKYDRILTDDCGICFDILANNKQVMLLNCDHSFHEECIRSWMNVKYICPTCRADINKLSEP